MLLSQNEILLFKLFISYPDREFYMQEIGRILRKMPGVFQRTINKMEEMGFIKSEFKANARFFRLDQGCDILNEITGIVKKRYGETDIYRNVIEKLDTEQKSTHKKTAGNNESLKKPDVALKIRKRVRLSDFQEGKVATSITGPEDKSWNTTKSINHSKKNKKSIVLTPSKEQLELF